ncbi:hypothetical protein B0H17DRAFT_1214344 [Mycena rosella]|uniref:Uncharacterized protein n=1 Tax=Mycena rosella TaxID=1033263 RepID=A0AAD7CNE7_MYCRO|nr:hypothetical protein B0H17DRAFT_1214344 [Mycena rosella]
MSIPSSSTPNGSIPARLLFDPSLATCPDFASSVYDTVRSRLNLDDNAAAIDILKESWTKSNDNDKAQWILQVEADRALAESEQAVRQQEAEKEAADAAKAAEDQCLEAEKKKPQLGDFDINSAPSIYLESRISVFAQKRLEKKEWCPLWPFTAAGLKEASNALTSSAEDGGSISLHRSDDNQLSIQSGPSSDVHKNMVRDENLTAREFSMGWHRYIKEITRANWSAAHVDALTQFFYGLDTHSITEHEHGGAITRIYADRYRFNWFNTLGTDQSFNLVLINEDLMNKIQNEYFMKLHSKVIAA